MGERSWPPLGTKPLPWLMLMTEKGFTLDGEKFAALCCRGPEEKERAFPATSGAANILFSTPEGVAVCMKLVGIMLPLLQGLTMPCGGIGLTPDVGWKPGIGGPQLA